MPISRAPWPWPAWSRVWPLAMSEPAKAMFWPGATARETRIAPSAVRLRSARSSPPSAPRGASAGGDRRAPCLPRRRARGDDRNGSSRHSATIRTGRPCEAAERSAALTANPSTTERSKGGASTGARISSARMRPTSRSSETCSTPSGFGRSAAVKSGDGLVARLDLEKLGLAEIRAGVLGVPWRPDLVLQKGLSSEITAIGAPAGSLPSPDRDREGPGLDNPVERGVADGERCEQGSPGAG